MEKDWRKSKKADELRDFIDKSFKARKPTMKNLERELVIDFVAKEVSSHQPNPSTVKEEI